MSGDPDLLELEEYTYEQVLPIKSCPKLLCHRNGTQQTFP